MNETKKRHLFPFLLASILPGGIASPVLSAPPEGGVTLHRCHEWAESLSESLKSRREDIRQSEARAKAALGGALPRLEWSLTDTRQDPAGVSALENKGFGGFVEREQVESKVSLTQPIFSGLREFSARSGFRRESARDALRLERSAKDLFERTAEVFYQVLGEETERDNTSAALDLDRNRIKELLNFKRLGKSRDSEVFAAQAHAAALNARLEQIQARIGSAREELSFLTGRDLSAAPLVDEIPVLPPAGSLQDSLAGAKDRADLRAQRKEVEARDLRVRYEKGAHWPSADVTGNYYTRRATFLDDVSWDVVLSAHVPLFQGGAVAARVREARSSRDQALMALEEMERRIIHDVREIHRELAAAGRETQALEEAARAAQKSYDALLGEYSLGLVTNLEVLQALDMLLAQKSARDAAGLKAKLLYIRLSLAEDKTAVTLSDLSIKNPVFAWMLMIGMILFGTISFTRIGKSQLPDVDFPVLTVLIKWEGASPEVMENEVIDVMENSLTSVKGVKKIASVTRQGQAMVTVEFELKTDINVALQEVQSKVAQAQYQLPKDMDPPIISKFNPDDQPFMWISLSGERPMRELMDFVKDEMKDKFTTIPGVGDVFMGGFIEPSVRVWLDPDKMRAREITVDDVLSAIRTEHAEMPAGYLSTSTEEKNVRVMGEAQDVGGLANLVISGRSGQPIYTRLLLKDVADVEDGLADARAISRVNLKPAIGLGILKQRNANMIEVSRLVKKKVDELQKSLPEGMKLAVNFDATMFIEQSTHELNFNLILASILTSAICWLFLGSWSSAVNIILAIPTSILGTFIILYFLGYTQNTFTLLGLTLVVGIVVDDAIMVLENIVRHREEGQSQVKAALLGAREIYFAAMAASVAILAIFVPVLFVKGVIGKFFLQFGVTISAAVMLSLLEALTLAPMRCSQFLKVGEHRGLSKKVDRGMDWLRKKYGTLLGACLRHRWKVVLSSAALFIGSLSLFGVVKKELMPAQDQSMLLVTLETPVGSSLEFTDGVFKKAEEYLLSQGEVERYYTAVGGFEGGEINSGMIFITLKQPKERPARDGRRKPRSQQELMDIFRTGLSGIPGVSKALLLDLSTGGGGAEPNYPADFTLQGEDWNQLGGLSEKFQEKLRESGLMVDINSNFKLGMPEVQIWPDRAEAARRGVSVASIGNAVGATLGGVRAGKFSKGGHRYDIRLRFRPKDRMKASDIDKIWVRNNRGQVVPLSDVVRTTEKKTLLSITRENRSRAIRITANMAPGKSQAQALAAVEKIGKEILPEGVKLVFSGAAETFKEAFTGLLLALILGVVVAYMILGAQFNSFLHPILVLMALPFSVTGAILALVVGHQSLNMFSMIGLVLLMGIVKKNSILLVDFTNERRRQGRSVHDALIEACPVRLRPVIMTSVSTIAAAVPPALALGPGAETRVPMALVIIGGVSVSTLLTLFVVPCAYSLMSRLENHKHDARLREALRELGELPAA